MNKLQNLLEKKLLPLAGMMQSNKILSSISNGLMAGVPFMIIGSLTLVISTPPVDYTTLDPGIIYTFIKGWTDLANSLGNILTMVSFASMNCFALISSAAIGYYLGQKLGIKGLSAMVNALVAFLVTATFTYDGELIQGFTNYGGQGLLSCIIVSVLSTLALSWLINHNVGKIKIGGAGVPPAITQNFVTLVPCAIIVFSWAIINTLCIQIAGVAFPNVIDLVMSPLVSILPSPAGTIIYCLLCSLGWWFGIHDNAFSGFSPFLWTAFYANQAAYAAGTNIYELPYIVNYGMYYTFVNIGGCGATFGLAVLLFLFSKSKQCKTVGKLGILPAFFNINEPIIFGVPLMMNPVFIIPMAITTSVNFIITYVATALKLVPHVVSFAGWNLWTPIGGFLATLSWTGSVLAIVLIIVDMLIYYPFFKTYDNQKLKEEANDPNQ